MRLVRFWDYFMRRKPLLVALFVMVASAVCSYQWAARRHGMNAETVATESPVVQTVDNGLELHILDENQAPVYRMALSNDFQLATVEVGTGSLANETYVRILDAAGNLVAGEYTTIYDPAQSEAKAEPESGVKYYFPETPKSYTVALAPGMKIELQSGAVKFYSTLDGVEVAEFAPRTEVESYIVTAGGLKRADWGDTQAQAVMYRQLKRYAEQQISRYRESIPEHVLYNKTLEAEKKAEIARFYAKLLPADQEAYTEFVEQLGRGGAPVITYRGALEYMLGETVDLLGLLDVHDNEDGEIAREKITAEGAVDFTKPGSYELVYSVTDSDGNTTRLTLTIVVTEERADAPSQTPSEDRPANLPSEVNGGDASVTRPTEEPAVIDMGAGVGVSEVAAEEIGTVWSAQELKVDYEPVAETAEEMSSVTEIVDEDTARKTTGETPTRPVERKTEKAAATNEETESKKVGANVFLIVVGLLVFCGLVKFIFDHYIR